MARRATSAVRGLFTRDATGLVRSFGFGTAFAIAMGNLNIGSSVAVLYALTPALYPGSDTGLVLGITILPLLVWALAYSMMAIIMPRSGGDYIYVARSLGGTIAFAFGIFELFVFVIQEAYNAVALSNFELEQGIYVQGLITKNNDLINQSLWFGQPQGVAVVASIALIVAGLVTMFGAKSFKYVQSTLLIIGLAGIATTAGVILTTPHAQFIQTFNSYFSGNSSYQAIINTVAAKGGVPPFSLLTTISALPFGILAYAGFTSSVFVAGETKQANKNVPLAIFLSLILGGAVMVALWYVVLGGFGADFVNSIGLLAFGPNSSAYPLPIPPTLILLAGLAANNSLISGFIGFSFTVWTFLLGPIYFLSMSRVLFAMSFDRIIPMRFANINARFHSPIYAVLLGIVLTIIVSILFAFGNFVAVTADTGLGWSIFPIIVGLGMIVFPFTRKAIFEQAPGWVKSRLGSIPLISIVGVILVLVMGLTAYYGWTASGLPWVNYLFVSVLVVGGLAYVGVRAYRKRQGVDLGLLFAEIPPE